MNFFSFLRIILLILVSLALFIQCPPEIPDEIAPVVNIIYPVDGQAVSGTIKVSVGASDETDLKLVNLFIDGEMVAASENPLLEYIWDTAPIADNQNHSLYATATDKSDNNGFSGNVIVRVVTGSFPDTLAPVITILNPVTGATVIDTVNVVSQVYDENEIDKVDYFVDGELIHTTSQVPYSYQWIVTNYENGSSHNLFGVAYDANQNSSVSNVVTVTVLNTDIIPPTVLIIYPAAASIFTAGDTVSVTVDAQDNIGIQRVEFYIDGLLRVTDTSRPYRYDWDTTGFGDGGTHTIYVKAFDFAGNNTAQLVTVTVNP
jgi:hypothetical protein